MNGVKRQEIKKSYVHDFLGGCDCDVFATVTLKQADRNLLGQAHYLGGSDHLNAAWFIRDRLRKKLPNRSKPCTFLPFLEGESEIKRYHLHILTQKPVLMPFEEYAEKFRSVAMKACAVYNEIDIRPIVPGSYLQVLKYSLKTGVDAFLPEASFLSISD